MGIVRTWCFTRGAHIKSDSSVVRGAITSVHVQYESQAHNTTETKFQSWRGKLFRSQQRKLFSVSFYPRTNCVSVGGGRESLSWRSWHRELLFITRAEQQQERQPWRTPKIFPNPIFVVDYVWLLSFILFIIAEKSVCALFVRWNRINILDTRYCRTFFFVFKLCALPM